MLRLLLCFLVSLGLQAQLYTGKGKEFFILQKADAVLKVTIYNMKNNQSHVGSGFFVKKNGEFLVNDHLMRNFNGDTMIQVADRHGNNASSISIGDCLGKKSLDVCKLKLNGFNVKSYFSFANTKHLLNERETRAVEAGYIGHCIKDFNYVDVRANFVNKKLRSKFINLAEEKMKSRKYIYNKDLIVLEGKHCPGDSGSPLFNERGELLGMLLNRFVWNTGDGDSYTYLALPVNEIESFLNVSSSFKRIPSGQIYVEAKKKKKKKDHYKL